MLIWRTRLGYEIRTFGFNPTATVYAGISVARITIITMLISGALAGMMSLNSVIGDQQRLNLDFVGGAGFVGIAVALMGRAHPVGIVLAALLFGILYQGGAELAFDMPAITRDMIVVIQGLVILFAGALENMFRPALDPRSSRRLSTPQPRRMATRGRVMDFQDVISTLAAAIRLSTPLVLAALAGLYSERSGVFDIGLEGKMLAGAFAAGAVAAVTGSAWLGLLAAIWVSVMMALVHGFASITQRGNQIVSGVAINFLASGLTAFLGHAWFGQGGQTPRVGNDARFRPITLPGADAMRDVPVIGRIYADVISGHNLLVYIAFLAVPFTDLGDLPHALRPAPARRRREPGRRRYGRHLGHRAPLQRRDDRRPPLRHRRHLSGARAIGRLRPRHDGGAGLHRARRADLRQLAALARCSAPASCSGSSMRPRSACRACSCPISARCRFSSSRRCPIS